MSKNKRLKVYRKILKKHFEKLYPDFFVFCRSLNFKHRLNIAMRILFLKTKRTTQK